MSGVDLRFVFGVQGVEMRRIVLTTNVHMDEYSKKLTDGWHDYLHGWQCCNCNQHRQVDERDLRNICKQSSSEGHASRRGKSGLGGRDFHDCNSQGNMAYAY